MEGSALVDEVAGGSITTGCIVCDQAIIGQQGGELPICRDCKTALKNYVLRNRDANAHDPLMPVA